MDYGRPKVAETPQELLDNPRIGPSLLNKYFIPAITGVTGVCGVLVGNYSSKRPVFSGIQKHIIAGVIGVAVGLWFEQLASAKNAERDAIFRDYIRLHPEDFPPFERKKFKDVFESWLPVR